MLRPVGKYRQRAATVIPIFSSPFTTAAAMSPLRHARELSGPLKYGRRHKGPPWNQQLIPGFTGHKQSRAEVGSTTAIE